EGERVKGKTVAIVDDIIGSGGTMLKAAEFVEADEVLFVGVHGVFSPGWERLKKLGEVVVTDTIERKESKVSVAGVIARWISSL
ncbi:MAG: ribose-phosphate pyrophosphokinase, partial [Candidatus Diapherotrites archaeon]|nr:ribose-phosphate pyrophosphokinase [Candidatus Diapherotrites archaeon]